MFKLNLVYIYNGNIIDKKIPISKLNMKEIALQLGSDIPFFLSKTNAAIVSGYGEKVKEINGAYAGFAYLRKRYGSLFPAA